MNIIPKVSVILPTYNGGRYIKKSIESVISQSFLDWELIVIDDGSTDNTEEIIKKIDSDKIIYLKNENNLGIQKSLNKGLEIARGEYISRIDDDDRWTDINKLERQVRFLESNKDYVLVGTGVIVVDEKENELFRYFMPETDIDIRNKILIKNCFIHSSVCFRKNLVLELGGYSEFENVKHLEDYDLWLKLGLLGKFKNLPSYSVILMLREESISSVYKIKQFLKNKILIKRYKYKYPNYFWAIIMAHLRIFRYYFVLKLPIKFSLNRILKFYKKYW
ncbi:MAG: hypothetical protein STSR0008_23760 [Ignavibacterium sp.]